MMIIQRSLWRIHSFCTGSQLPRGSPPLSSRYLAKWAPEKKKKPEDFKQDDARIQKLLKMYAETKQKQAERTPEELKDGFIRAKAYNKKKMEQHREIQRDMSQKRRLLRAALAALPEHLKGPAAELDDNPPPTNMPFPTDTPPTTWT